MQHRIMGIVIALSLLLTMVVGCGSSAPASDSAKPTAAATISNKASNTLEEGWTLVEKKSDGFAVALPPKWGEIDLDPDTMADGIKKLAADNPNLSGTLTEQAKNLQAQGIKFYGFDLSADSLDSEFSTNVNVIAQTLPGTISVDDFGTAVKDQLENQFDGATIKLRKVTTAAGDAIEIKYDMPLQLNGKTVNLAMTQYGYMKGKQSFILTCTTDNPDKYNALFEKIGQYFRIIN